MCRYQRFLLTIHRECLQLRGTNPCNELQEIHSSVLTLHGIF
jgi:hypothetical protein